MSGAWGGDEFLVLLRSISGPEAAMRVARRISKPLTRPFVLSSGPVSLCASLGVSCANATTITAEGLVERADAAMYRSKDQGKGLPVFQEDVG